MQQFTRWSGRIMAVVAMTIMTTLTAWAGVPAAPTDLSGYATSNDGFGGIVLTWTPADQSADGFNVYMSTDEGSSWELIAAVTDSASTLRSYHTTGRLPNGSYQFQTTAFNGDGESDRSNTATVVLEGLGIRFTSRYYQDSTYIGDNFQRDFDAEASNDGEIVYSLVDAADGMAIDAATGVFSWTPTVGGHYVINVVATLADNPAIQTSTIYVVAVRFRPTDFCASVSGTVTDHNGAPVEYGEVSVIYMSGGQTFTFTGGINNGAFQVAVPAGAMVVLVGGGNFAPEYYNNAISISQAEVLTLSCGDNRALAITVAPEAETMRGQIFGSLVDTAGHHLSGHIIAYRIDSTNGPVQAAETWARGGYFAFHVLPAGDYVIWGNSTDSVRVPGYHVANDAAALSWTEATRVTLHDGYDSASVQIRLVHVEGGGSARLIGTVVSEGGRIRKHDDPRILGATPVEGATVYAIDQSNNVGGYAITNAEGRFEISELQQGAYTVLVDRIGLRPLYQPVTVADDAETVIDLQISSTSSVAGTADAVKRLGIYPNPVDASARIRFDAAVGTTELRLIDLRGTEVVSMSIPTTAGENSVTLETAGLPAGLYLLRIGSGSGASSAMITIAR